jgi:hypothetical protein
MATLVLTAVGTALGGPIGGALGALLGQSVDAALFAPRARQGPRLTDFKVQTSSYGDRIPRLYGRMRVAGSVIWATDLIERRSKRSNGKGRPKTVEYHYSVSFAVALSSRPITAVHRIWADGNILRDASGALAEAGDLRIHDGTADQPPDPLIASLLGPDQCSAFRGLAYAVFEGLELAAFGNRIPQLSFEVECDPAAVPVAAIVTDLTGLAAPAPGPLLGGYAAGGERLREVIAPLIDHGDLLLHQHGGGLTLAAADHVPPLAAAPAHIAAAAPLVADATERRAAAQIPIAVRLRHYDPARDYQTSEQAASVAGGGGAARALDLPAALAADAARAAVQRQALVMGERRRSVRVRGGMGAMALPLGAVLTAALAGDRERRWRLADRQLDAGGVQMQLVEQGDAPALPLPAADGGTALVGGAIAGTDALLHIFDLPGDGEAVRTAPLRLIAAAGQDPGWRGADLWWVAASGTEPEALGRIGAAAALGTTLSALAAPRGRLLDRGQSVDIALANDAMALQNASFAALVNGANAAMLGGEMVQFERAAPLGDGRWRLTGLLRDRGGTGGGAAGHAAGAPFVLIDDAALLTLPDALAQRSAGGGAAIDWLARGSLTMNQAAIAPGMAALVPLTPVHGRAVRLADGAVQLRWTSRSRAGRAWRDAVDAPLGESRLAFRLRWQHASGNPAGATSDIAASVLAAGSYLPGSAVLVEQVGDYGLSGALAITLPPAA